jgi:hypothetical protein
MMHPSLEQALADNGVVPQETRFIVYGSAK